MVVHNATDTVYDLIQGFMGVVLHPPSIVANGTNEASGPTTSDSAASPTESITTTTTTTTTTDSISVEPTIPPGAHCSTPTECPSDQACFASEAAITCQYYDTIGFRLLVRTSCARNTSTTNCPLTFVWTGAYSFINQPCVHVPNSPDLVNLTISNPYLSADVKYLGSCGPDAFCNPSKNDTCQTHQLNGTACDSDLQCIPVNPGKCVSGFCQGSYATTVTIVIQSNTPANVDSGIGTSTIAIIVCCVLGTALLLSCAMWFLCRGKKVQYEPSEVFEYDTADVSDQSMTAVGGGGGSGGGGGGGGGGVEHDNVELLNLPPPPPYSTS